MNFSLYLYKTPLWIVTLLLIIFALIWMKINAIASLNIKRQKAWRLLNCVFLLFASYFIIHITLISRTLEIKILNIKPFSLIFASFTQPEIYRSVFMNVALFVPFGIVLSQLLPKHSEPRLRFAIVILSGLLFSICIECVQFVYSLGQTEIDDLICNTFGSMLGGVTVFYDRISKLFKKFSERIPYKACLITFVFSWFFWGNLSLFTSWELLSFSTPLSTMMYVIGFFGPFVATILSQNIDSLKHSLLLSNTKNIKSKHSVLLILSTAILLVISSCELKNKATLGLMPAVLVLMTVVFGIGEELGWRISVFKELHRRYSFAIATIATNSIWILWHIPLFYVIGSPLRKIHFLVFFILYNFLGLCLNYLYVKTDSVCLCCVFKGIICTIFTYFVFKFNIVLIIGIVLISLYVLYAITEKNTTTKNKNPR